MHRLTNNFDCWIVKDGQHFAIHNISENSVDAGYKLGEYAEFEDDGVKYKVTITESDVTNLLKID